MNSTSPIKLRQRPQDPPQEQPSQVDVFLNDSPASSPSKSRPKLAPSVRELLPTLPYVARAVAEVLLVRDPESGQKYVRQLVASNRNGSR